MLKGDCKMNERDFLDYLNSGKTVAGGSETHQFMHGVTQKALKITAEINGKYHEPEELRELFSELIGKKVDESFGMFPPFYTDCGKNITIGKNVFINMGCKFQDQGGITIGDGTLIGHNVVIATLNHDMEPLRRSDLHPSPVHIGKNVWIGSGAVILPGVTIGDGTIIGAGAVVTKDVPGNVVAAGVPAKIMRKLENREAA